MFRFVRTQHLMEQMDGTDRRELMVRMWKNTRNVLMNYLFLGLVTMGVLYLVSNLTKVPAIGAFSTLTIFGQTLAANFHVLAVGMSVWIIASFVWKGMWLRDTGSMVTNGISLMFITVFLAGVELLSRFVSGGAMNFIVHLVHAPLYVILMSGTTTFHTAPLYLLTAPWAFYFAGLELRIFAVRGFHRFWQLLTHRPSSAGQ